MTTFGELWDRFVGFITATAREVWTSGGPNWEYWDRVGGTLGGIAVVLGALWWILQRTFPPLKLRRERRLRWHNHLTQTINRAKLMPDEGLDPGPTREYLASSYIQLAVKLAPPLAAVSNPVPAPTSELLTGDIWQLMRAHRKPVLFVLGRPGSGKTTLIHHMAGELAACGRTRIIRSLRTLWRRRPNAIPIWFRLRDYKDAPDIVAVLDSHLADLPSRYLILLDGLDEVSESQRQQVAQWINHRSAAATGTPEQARWLVTARPEGFEKDAGDYCALEIQPLDMPRITALVHAHFRQDPAKAASLLDQIRRRETYYQFARNPLLLRMMVDLHRTSQSAETRVELYRKILLTVLEARLKDKHGAVALQGEELLRVLGKVAWEMGERLEVPEAELRQMIDRHTPKEVEAHVQAAFHFFPGDSHRREFAHRSFQEYLAAAAVPEDDPVQLFTRRGGSARKGAEEASFWNETIRFYAMLSPARFLAVFSHFEASSPALLIECGLEIPFADDDGVDAWKEPRARFNYWLESRLNHPTGWRTAAEARLAVRLWAMQPRGQDAVADRSLITNAELQLFLDTEAGSHHVPLHWMGPRFAAGSGPAPALGVSPACAQKVCKWLSEREPLSVYSLPTLEGSSRANPPRGPGSPWCLTTEGLPSCEAPQPASQDAARAALQRLAETFDLGRALAVSFDLDRALDLDGARADFLAVAFADALRRALDLASALPHSLALDRALGQARDYVLALGIGRDRALAIELAVALPRARARAVDLALDRAPALALDRASADALAHALAAAFLVLATACQHRMHRASAFRDSLQRDRDRCLDVFLQALIRAQRRRQGNPLFAPFEGILLVKRRRDSPALPHQAKIAR